MTAIEKTYTISIKDGDAKQQQYNYAVCIGDSVFAYTSTKEDAKELVKILKKNKIN